jgi:hypothetical protein
MVAVPEPAGAPPPHRAELRQLVEERDAVVLHYLRYYGRQDVIDLRSEVLWDARRPRIDYPLECKQAFLGGVLGRHSGWLHVDRQRNRELAMDSEHVATCALVPGR